MSGGFIGGLVEDVAEAEADASFFEASSATASESSDGSSSRIGIGNRSNGLLVILSKTMRRMDLESENDNQMIAGQSLSCQSDVEWQTSQ